MRKLKGKLLYDKINKEEEQNLKSEIKRIKVRECNSKVEHIIQCSDVYNYTVYDVNLYQIKITQQEIDKILSYLENENL